MAIAKRPGGGKPVGAGKADEKAIDSFISGAGGAAPKGDSGQSEKENKKGVMIYVEPELLAQVDQAARKRGVSRSAFFNFAASKIIEKGDG